MTAKTMASVLAAHLLDCVMYIGTGQEYLCICGVRSSDHDVHQAEELAGAGFGLVVEFTNRQMQLAALMAYDAVEEGALREAGAKGWDEAVNEADRRWQIGHASASILRMDNPYRAKETS